MNSFLYIICYWEILNLPIFTFIFDDVFLGKLEAPPFCFFNNAREPIFFVTMHLLSSRRKKNIFFFSNGALLIEFKAPFFFFFVYFPFYKEKKVEIFNEPHFCFRMALYKKKPICKKKAPINTNQQQMNTITNKEQTNVLGAPSMDAK